MIPDKVFGVLAHIRRTGRKPEGYIGNRRYHNLGAALPADGDYREFDVDPKPLIGPRASGRLILDRKTGRVWYTDDHYETFTELEEGGSENDHIED